MEVIPVTKYNFVTKKAEEIDPLCTWSGNQSQVDCLDKACVFCEFRGGLVFISYHFFPLPFPCFLLSLVLKRSLFLLLLASGFDLGG